MEASVADENRNRFMDSWGNSQPAVAFFSLQRSAFWTNLQCMQQTLPPTYH